MEAVFVALIVAGVGVFGQWLLRRQDFARQDQVAAQAAEAARLLLEANERVAWQSAAEFAATQRQLGQIETQGKTIHQLVNQKLTDVTELALQATEALLPHLEEAIARHRAGGEEPSAASLERLDQTRRSIVDLRSTLLRRNEQQREVDADVARTNLGGT